MAAGHLSHRCPTPEEVSEVVGPYTWGLLHAAVETFPCPTCAEHGGRLMRGLHDLVNARLSKPIHAPADFDFLTIELDAARRQAGLASSLSELEREVLRLAQETGVIEDPSTGSGQALAAGVDLVGQSYCVVHGTTRAVIKRRGKPVCFPTRSEAQAEARRTRCRVRWNSGAKPSDSEVNYA